LSLRSKVDKVQLMTSLLGWSVPGSCSRNTARQWRSFRRLEMSEVAYLLDYSTYTAVA